MTTEPVNGVRRCHIRSRQYLGIEYFYRENTIAPVLCHVATQIGLTETGNETSLDSTKLSTKSSYYAAYASSRFMVSLLKGQVIMLVSMNWNGEMSQSQRILPCSVYRSSFELRGLRNIGICLQVEIVTLPRNVAPPGQKLMKPLHVVRMKAAKPCYLSAGGSAVIME